MAAPTGMLAPGTKLGPYEIVGALGAGGMGEVYRAHDARLDRVVAIKILPDALATDDDHLHRFEREARSTSALNHPNIVTIHDLGRDGSVHYIVMELVEGTTVRDLLKAGAVPIRQSIDIAAQIAEGLAKAHEAGIAHRDIKPGNLMITADGFVKILDFGLAKLVPAGEALSQLHTRASSDTRSGVILGTPEYMSPEQAGGLPIDFRSDQFSLGLVLYEMVTGKRAFRRATAAETLVAILREQPDPVATLVPEAPAPLCWAIERCIAKEPEKRYASTRDLAHELAAIRDRLAEKVLRQSRQPNIPVQRTAFVGREKEIEAAKELLLRPDVRLVTITGPGGIGKTRLGIEIASAVADHFPGGIHFVALSAVNDPGLLLSVIVQALGLREAGGQSPLELLKKHLQDPSRPPMLFLLDNFEHLLQAAPTLADLLAMGPNLKLLVTSRAALHIYGEHEFPVPPLAVPDSRSKPTIDDLSKYPAVALFLQRAGAAKPDFELNEENSSAIIEICSRLDGLPLAIELAAARVKVLSVAAMRTRLASRLQLLTGGARDLPQRQQTLRAAIDWSYDLLSPAEQKLFRRLSVFAGGSTLESVEAVCDAKADLDLDLLDGMASMVDKSLVQQVTQPHGESRFTMLETIREYAREKLEASNEEASTRRAHAAYCLVIAEEAATEQGETVGAEWLENFVREHDNFRAALDWLTETGDADWGLRLGAALFRFWERLEYLSEGRDWLGKLLKLPAAAASSRARARALFAAGILTAEQGDYLQSEVLIAESRDVSRELGDKQGVAVSLNALAVSARDRGDLALANALSEENLELWREIGDPRAIARAISNLASVAKLQRDFTRARSLYDECQSLFHQLGDRTGVAWSINYKGDVARDEGDSASARSLYEQALSMFREIGDRWGVAGTLADLGNLAREQRDCATAHALYRESLKVFQELEHRRGIARLLECFACSASIQFQAERSLRLAGAAAALRQNIGAPLTPAEQAKLDTHLDPARYALANTSGATAWLEGWGMPLEKAIEKAIEEALRSDAESSSA
ncbi:MAG TPA: protein kinase [Candidatus Acidoferrales bacterium]